MTKRYRNILISVIIIIGLSVAYFHFGKWEYRFATCSQCELQRLDIIINPFVIPIYQKFEVHNWYMRHDPSHKNHTWEVDCGYKQDWLCKGDTCHYDMFPMKRLVSKLHDDEPIIPKEMFATLLSRYIASDGSPVNKREINSILQEYENKK